jgi:hypothetical protein
LWILSEAREESGERNAGVEKRLEVGDIANDLLRLLQKDGTTEDMDDVQIADNEETEEMIGVE